MYEVDRYNAPASATQPIPRRAAGVSRNVWAIGVTSLLTDVSAEMMTAILPLFLVATLGISPLAFGAIDGLQHALGAIVRWTGGILGDRTRHYKRVAAMGYALSAVIKPLWLVTSVTAPVAAALVGVDRLGKGLRTAPRDALISLSSSPATLGSSFGVHRALDATGAMIGPIVAVAVLGVDRDGFDVIFILSFGMAMAGLGVLLLFVQNRSAEHAAPGAHRPSSIATARHLARQPSFLAILLIAGSVSLVTISDAFLYLALQRQVGFDVNLLPMLYVVTSFAYLMLAFPLGYVADRLGRPAVFAAGHGALLIAYVAAGTPLVGGVAFWVTPIMLGVYYGATDGVIAAITSARVQPSLRGSGLALMGSVIGLSRAASSLAFGWAWVHYGHREAIVAFGALLVCVAAPAGYALIRLDENR